MILSSFSLLVVVLVAILILVLVAILLFFWSWLFFSLRLLVVVVLLLVVFIFFIGEGVTLVVEDFVSFLWSLVLVIVVLMVELSLIEIDCWFLLGNILFWNSFIPTSSSLSIHNIIDII